MLAAITLTMLPDPSTILSLVRAPRPPLNQARCGSFAVLSFHPQLRSTPLFSRL